MVAALNRTHARLRILPEGVIKTETREADVVEIARLLAIHEQSFKVSDLMATITVCIRTDLFREWHESRNSDLLSADDQYLHSLAANRGL